MRKEVSVQLRFNKERDAGVVGQDTIAARRILPMPAQIGQRLHREKMRTEYRVVFTLTDEVAKLLRVADIGQIDRRSHARRAVHLPGVVHHAENVRSLGRNAIEHLVEAQRAGIAEHVEHIQKLRLMALPLQRLLDSQRTVVVALAGAAAEKQYLHSRALLCRKYYHHIGNRPVCQFPDMERAVPGFPDTALVASMHVRC